jgi:MoxR-like ATPase
MQRLKAVLSRVPQSGELRAEIGALRDELRRLGRFGRLVGRSPAMQEVYDKIARVAPTEATVLLLGESGTGKEIVARTIHELSRRRKQPFLAINCGAISPNLIENEMFGHERGSYTGADRQHKGYFEQADGGTLFLDEITEMPLELQVRLLRVLETGTLMRIGTSQPIETDVRIIAATNRDPREAVRAGKLREDLYHRLNVFPLEIAPLRERGEDIELIASHFLDELNAACGTRKKFAPGAIARMRSTRGPATSRAQETTSTGLHHGGDEGLEGPTRKANRHALRQPSIRRPRSPCPRHAAVGRGARAHPLDARALRRRAQAHRRDARHLHQDALQPPARVRHPGRAPSRPLARRDVGVVPPDERRDPGFLIRDVGV